VKTNIDIYRNLRGGVIVKKIVVFFIIVLTLMRPFVFATISTEEKIRNLNEEQEREKTRADLKFIKEKEAKEQETLYDDIIVTFLAPTIDKVIDDYYKSILKGSAHYGGVFYTKIICIKRISGPDIYRSANFIIEVEITPYVGPHMTVGRDRILIKLEPDGTAIVLGLEHLEDHELPEHMKGYYLH